MNEKVFEDFRVLSKMHFKTMEAFECFANIGEDGKYRDLLEFWLNYLKDEPTCSGQPVELEALERYEEELYHSYSPIGLRQEHIACIRKDVVKYLQYYSMDALIQKKSVLLVSRLLYNCLLMERCFFPLYNIVYQDHISNIINQLNICIIVGQLDYFSEYFRQTLHQFNEEFASLREVSVHILHLVGILNFKCHNYKQAIEIFLRAISRFEDEEKSDAYKNDEYFQTKLLLAYCYEYNHQFERAIEVLLEVSVDDLLGEFKGFKMFTLFNDSNIDQAKRWAENFISNTLPRIIEKYASSQKAYALLEVARQRDVFSNAEIGDKHEVLHTLAHCLNELGIKKDLTSNSQKDSVISLLFLSRAIMLYVAEYSKESRDFQTCLYMLFGEAKDYDVCLKRINQVIKEYEKSGVKNINYEMENMFYLFLVANHSGRVINDTSLAEKAENAYQRFTQFAKSRYDYDALTHIEIFKFRFEIINILRSSIDNMEIEKNLIALKNEPFGKYVISTRPSAKANRWIMQEYKKTIALYEFLVKYFEDQNIININELYNYACHFRFYRNMFVKGEDSAEVEDMEAAINQIIETIVDDFLSPQSIFILAPITSAIPYQHQTKTFLTLEDHLFETQQKKFNSASKMGPFTDLVSAKHPNLDHTNWLLAHKEYSFSFSASRIYPSREENRYYYCDDAEIFDRPIYNVAIVNKMIENVTRHKKRHKYCQNGQTSCCITIFNDSNSEQIKSICRELMIPAKKYQDKTFVFYYKQEGPQKNPEIYWHIIGIDQVICRVQEQEIISLLCGHDLNPEYKLAVSRKNYCYVCYDVANSMVAKSDMYWLQEHGIRFWYDREMKGSKGDIPNPGYLDEAKALLIIISRDNFGANADQSRLYKEILYAVEHNLENRIIIAIDFKDSDDLTKYFRQKFREKINSVIFSYLIGPPIIYGTMKDEDEAIMCLEKSNILTQLKKYGVENDDI